MTLEKEIQAELELPGELPLLGLPEVIARVEKSPKLLHIAGVEGSGGPLVAHALLHRGPRLLVYLVADAELGGRALHDFEFYDRYCPIAGMHRACTDHHGPLPIFPSEPSIYSEVLPDRRIAMMRLGSLYRLASRLLGTTEADAPKGARVVVMPARALVRRVIPPQRVHRAGLELSRGQAIDLGAIAAHLTEAGYLRVPLVEDPGTFSVRGSLLDVWPASLATPARIEVLGDDIVEIRTFDPESQRSKERIELAVLPPAREHLAGGDLEPVRARLRALCDAVNLPSTKARAFIDGLISETRPVVAEAYLPAFTDLVPIWEYFPDQVLYVIEDPSRVTAAIGDEWEQAIASEPPPSTPHFAPEALLVTPKAIFERLASASLCLHRTSVLGGKPTSAHDSLISSPALTPTLGYRDQRGLVSELTHERARGREARTLNPLWQRLTAQRDAGFSTMISARTRAQLQRLGSLLEHRGLEFELEPPLGSGSTDPSDDLRSSGPIRKLGSNGSDPSLRLVVGGLGRGLIAPSLALSLITEEEIFGERAHRAARTTRASKRALDDLRALEIGDFVVHQEHGIGRYLGLEHKSVGTGVKVDLLVIEYAGKDRLFLPVYRLNQIQKYSGQGASPRLDRLGGSTFSKTKARARQKIREMADELLRLYAERSQTQKPPIPPLDDDYMAFEASFPFEETPDQAAAIADVLGDLGRPEPMDRLVCGDVGFGKTEVALRAAFRHALAGHQVALLCPTTVLAQQHYQTFIDRFAGYPLKVGLLSRFQSQKEQDATAAGLRSGAIDVVVGTHRVLSRDVRFLRLGLLIVDEEQRFGVRHKERIKQLCQGVDVLTLSATPIPRTLQLAVTGIRDMSVIATPPADRRAIRTLIARLDESVIREAITRELGRGGQVFYVYNRIEGIHERAEMLRSLFPRARIAVGHGQMRESILEQTMVGFVRGDYDILVSTAIVESGLDIPRANTMLIDRADLFGLSQLYQLRGRVGRAKERAYCYLLIPSPSELSDDAEKRIEALVRYSELSSGFQIATLDMELRGGGNLLGAEQSGTVATVGYDLFCEMLAETTQELRGIEVKHDVDPELSFDLEALLPEEYIPEVGVRLSLYKRLASAQDDAEVLGIAGEMEDRFGAPPVETVRLVELMGIKTELRRLKVLSCEATRRSITLTLREDTPLDTARLASLIAGSPGIYRLTPDRRLTRKPKATEFHANSIAFIRAVLRELESVESESN